jgi:hypothetical protein
MVMKKLILYMALILIASPLVAQTKYRGIVEGAYSFLQDNKSGLSFQVSTIHGVRLGSYFIGGGIGIEGDQIDNPSYTPQADIQLLDDVPYIGLKTVSTTSVPVFLEFRSMWDRHAVMPMFDLRVGVSFGEVFGPFVEPGAGIRIRLYNVLAISANVFGKILYDPGIVTDMPPCTDGLFKQVGMRVALEF